MKGIMKKSFIATLVFIGLIALLCKADTTYPMSGESPDVKPVPHIEHNQSSPIDLKCYLDEVSLTESGLTNFFKCYNNPFYSRRFLPSCFLHVVDFLKFIPWQADPWSYSTTIFSMFLTKLKGCVWTNSFALVDLLESLPTHLEPLAFVDKFRQNFKDQLRQKTLMFAVKDPNECVDILLADFDRYHETLNKITEFQFELTRFLDTSCDRLIWDPSEDKVVWDSFKRLGFALKTLSDKRIILGENCNEIMWSLVHSFVRFVDVCSVSLSLKWYDHVLKDIVTATFLQAEEVDPLMQSKTAYLTKSIKLGYAQALMYQKNLVTPQK